MRVYFVEPPAAKRIGGLDAAVRALEKALRDLGLDVSNQSPVKAQRGDVIHFHALWEPSHAHISRTLARGGAAMIVSPHGMLEPWAWRHRWWKKWPYYWLVERQHLHRANALLATAPPEAQRLKHFLPTKRVATIPLGLTEEATQGNYADARRSLGWSPDETILLYLSRIHPKKGLDLLLHALSTIDVPPRARLVVVGGGDRQYLANLRNIADRLRDSLPRIDWIGDVWGPARWPYFEGADLFCLPTHSENFGLAVLEACSVGTASLTTTTTPWKDWLANGRGLIAEPTMESIAAKLNLYFQQSADYARNRSSLASWAKGEFSWQALAPRYAELYQNLISAEDPSSPL